VVVDSVAYEVHPYVNVFHMRVGLWVMHTCNRPLVVTVERRGVLLREADLVEKRA